MSELGFRRTCYAVLFVLTLIAALGGVHIARNGLHIDTNLKSLSPPLSQDAVINTAVDSMTAATSKKIIIAIAGENADEVEESSQALTDKINNQKNPVQYVDQSIVLKNYLELLAQYRFYITGKNAQEILREPNEEEILTAARNNLYGSGGAVRLIPLSSDPLGFVNEYALDAAGKLSFNHQDELQKITIDGTDLFVSNHVLQLSADALEMGEQESILGVIEQLKKETLGDHTSVQWLESGMIFFAADSARTAKSDINIISMGSTIAVLVLFLGVFRSLTSLVIPVVSMILGPLFAFCVCQLLFGSIHILTIVFGASLIGVVGDYSLHFYYFYNKKKSSENLVQLYQALLLSLITSVIGYSALALSGLDALKQVAVFSALGLVYSWLLVISIGSILVKDNRIRVHDRILQKTVAKFLRLFSRLNYRAYILLAVAVLFAVLFAGRFTFPANDSPKAFFALNPHLVEQEKIISGVVSSYEPASFIVVDAKSEQQLYDRIDLVKKAIGQESDNLLSVQDFFPSPQEQKSNYEANQYIYKNADILDKFLQENPINDLTSTALVSDYENKKLQPLSPRTFFSQQDSALPSFWVESNGKISSFILLPKSIDTSKLNEKLRSLDGVRFVSAVADIESSLKHLRFSALQLLFVALLMISAIVFFRYGIQQTLKIMFVPAFSIILTIASLAAVGIPITLFHIMALFLVLGLSMDYVIFASEMHGESVATLSAIVLAAVTSLLSFGLLVLSSLPAVSAFGMTVIIGSAMNLFGAMALASQQINYKKV